MKCDCTADVSCACMVNGWLLPKCGPEEYRWAIDQLVEECGEANVRVGWLQNFGREQGVFVSPDEWKKFIRIPLKYDGFDLNKAPPGHFEAILENVRAVFRGFGV